MLLILVIAVTSVLAQPPPSPPPPGGGGPPPPPPSCASNIPSTEQSGVSFTEPVLQSKNSCNQVTLHECLTYHDANSKNCPCTCQYVIQKCQTQSCSPHTTKSDLDNGNNNNNNQQQTNGPQPPTTVGPTAAPTTQGPMGGGLMCFSGDTKITTNKGELTLEELARETEKDVQILSWNRVEKREAFSPLKFWIHADPTQEAEFLEIVTENGHRLSITDNHVIYRSIDCDRARSEAVFASKIAPSDCLYVQDGMEKVSTVTPVQKVGIYAPITQEGSIIVNKIAASCYANNENEDIQRFIYHYIWAAADWLQGVLPSSWMSHLFGIDLEGPVHGSIPAVLSGFDALQKNFLAK